MSNRQSSSVALEHPEPLVAIGSRIRDKFSALTAHTLPGKEAAVPASLLENECQRFALWATNLGLYTTGHSSLDYRLGDAPLIYEYTEKALHDLENYLGIRESMLNHEFFRYRPINSSPALLHTVLTLE